MIRVLSMALLLAVAPRLLAEVISDATLARVLAIGKDAGVPRSVTLALMHEESRGNPNARSRAVQGYRSRGLFQIYEHPRNLRQLLNRYWYARLDGHVGEDRRFDILDPIENATVALRYLSALHREWGSWYEALLFYNSGTVKRAPKDTRAYARRIVNAR